jgi:hypothetical protein
VVDPERQKHPVPSLYEFGEDDRLRSLTNIDGMARRWAWRLE